jgi:hypothetical protein
MATVFIIWGTAFEKNEDTPYGVRPLSYEDEAFEVLDVDSASNLTSSNVPAGANLACIVSRNGDVCMRVNETVPNPAMGVPCMDGAPQVVPVKQDDVLNFRERAYT